MSKQDRKPTDEEWIDFFQGKSSEEAYIRLKSLMEQGEADEVMERLFETQFSADQESAVKVDSAESFAKLQEKMEPKHERNAKRLPYKWIAFAASLALLLALGIIFQLKEDASVMQFSSGGMEIRKVTLPDGSEVTLNANSNISYTEEEGKRAVLLSGEAFFDVARNEKVPFVITVRHTEVTVLGTSFNVKAINSEETVVSVRSGKVQVDNGNHQMVLVQNEQAISSALALHKSEANEHNTSWMQKRLVYDSVPLELIFMDIESWYGINIISDTTIDTIPYTASVNLDKGLDVFLQNLSISENINFTISRDNVSLSKK
ncbi:FecR family protein [Flagellimonas meridianipacifica]|uniref:Ferric-dicitrate binding protein FerR (Iron transport regulator) n=1 Tax=Flagellimonas meridianipacifica TaxID=1080225 RepID=A0A2T0M8N4_9FLAO|nr:FecR family protein [Allomuricauda pacifica]PRX53840.1 ferric-dicitrate binding protein FerR (iron transport regulator) [Allomuricauda pacifica]